MCPSPARGGLGSAPQQAWRFLHALPQVSFPGALSAISTTSQFPKPRSPHSGNLFSKLQLPLHMCVHSVLSCVRLSVTPRTVPARILCPWDSPGKNTALGCHFLLQGLSPTQGSNPCLLHLLHSRLILYPLSHLGSTPTHRFPLKLFLLEASPFPGDRCQDAERHLCFHPACSFPGVVRKEHPRELERSEITASEPHGLQ